MNEKKFGEAYKLIPNMIVNFSHCFFFLMTKNEKNEEELLKVSSSDKTLSVESEILL